MTIQQWLKKNLTQYDYELALKYKTDKWNREVDFFQKALKVAFVWGDTKEGYRFWDKVYENDGSVRFENLTDDRIVLSVMEDLNKRSLIGQKKYGTTLDREDLSLLDWLQHRYEEILDDANYTKKIIDILKNEQRGAK